MAAEPKEQRIEYWAIDRLVAYARNPNQPGAVRLRAALAVFELAIKGVEVEDIDARVTALENVGDASKKRK
jgi:hypothetical protein